MNENIKPDVAGMCEIAIALGDAGDGRKTVTAFIVGHFAYRPIADGEEVQTSGQLITHVRTGRKLASWFDAPHKARNYLLALRDYLDEEEVDADTSNVKLVRKRLRPHRDMIEELALSHGGCAIFPEKEKDE